MITGNSAKGITKTASQIRRKFKTCIDEETFRCIELTLENVDNGIFVRHKHSVWKVVCHFGMENCNAVPSPLPAGFTVEWDTSESFQKKVLVLSGMLIIHLRYHKTRYLLFN